MPDTLTITALKAWLVDQGIRAVPRPQMLNGFCTELINHGVPLVRMQLAQRALHPEFGGIGFTWTRADGLNFEYFRRPDQAVDAWLNSPFYAMISSGEAELCADLTGEEGTRFPIFSELRAQGGTSYFAHWQPIGGEGHRTYVPETMYREGVLASWTLDGDPGAAEAYRDIIRACFETLVVVLSAEGNREMGRELLKVYLGRDAGERVLSGEIQRGSSQLIDAVICLFDLRGFTALSEQLPGTVMVDLLNDYFGHVVEIIQAHGGNILKFMGDGVMAMFNLGTLEEDARAALAAVRALAPRMEAVNAARILAGLPQADYTLALHAGEILYGNIGAPNRLDFTVIGPTVNLTARIADMHRTVERSVILSEHVRRAAGEVESDLVSVGRYMLRGVGEPIELFTLFDAPRASRSEGRDPV